MNVGMREAEEWLHRQHVVESEYIGAELGRLRQIESRRIAELEADVGNVRSIVSAHIEDIEHFRRVLLILAKASAHDVQMDNRHEFKAQAYRDAARLLGVYLLKEDPG